MHACMHACMYLGLGPWRQRLIAVAPGPHAMAPRGRGGVAEKPKDQGTAGEFATGLKKTSTFQPCIIEQNKGSSGEGIWIIKLL